MSDIPLIRVRGEAVLKVEPELARLTVHLQARDKDYAEPIDLETGLQTVRAAVETCFTATAPDDL